MVRQISLSDGPADIVAIVAALISARPVAPATILQIGWRPGGGDPTRPSPRREIGSIYWRARALNISGHGHGRHGNESSHEFLGDIIILP
jgi:hypothetical protein